MSPYGVKKLLPPQGYSTADHCDDAEYEGKHRDTRVDEQLPPGRC